MSEEEYELYFDRDLKRDDFLESESDSQESIEKESIPYLMHKEMCIPLLECQKAYDIGIEYLRSQGKLKG